MASAADMTLVTRMTFRRYPRVYHIASFVDKAGLFEVALREEVSSSQVLIFVILSVRPLERLVKLR